MEIFIGKSRYKLPLFILFVAGFLVQEYSAQSSQNINVCE